MKKNYGISPVIPYIQNPMMIRVGKNFWLQIVMLLTEVSPSRGFVPLLSSFPQ